MQLPPPRGAPPLYGVSSIFGRGRDQPVRVWEERPAGGEYTGPSFALRVTKQEATFLLRVNNLRRSTSLPPSPSTAPLARSIPNPFSSRHAVDRTLLARRAPDM